MQIFPVSFGYKTKLSENYKKGKIPLEKGLYGGKLTKENKTNEHIRPVSKGGKTTLNNIALATAENNQKRGNDPLLEYLTMENLIEYTLAFLKMPKVKGFDPVKYIIGFLENTLQTIREGY